MKYFGSVVSRATSVSALVLGSVLVVAPSAQAQERVLPAETVVTPAIGDIRAEVSASGLAVWQRTPFSGASEIWGRFLAGDGEAFQISATGSAEDDGRFDAVTPSVAFDRASRQYLVAWSANGHAGSAEPGRFAVRGVVLDERGSQMGSVIDIRDDSDKETARDLRWPQAVWTGKAGAYYVAWTRQSDDGRFELRGTEVTGSSATRPEALSKEGVRAIRPALARGGNAVVAAWEARLEDGTRTVQATVLGGQPLEMPAEAEGGRRPAVTALEGGEVEITWSAVGVSEPLSARFVVAESGPGLELPQGTILAEAYPNPFHTSASVRVGVAEDQEVEVVVFDMLGRVVQTLYSGSMRAGVLHDLSIDGSGLTSGSYVVQVRGETVQKNVPVVRVR